MTTALPDDPTPAEFIDWVVAHAGGGIPAAARQLGPALDMDEPTAQRYLYRWRSSARGPGLGYVLKLLTGAGLLAEVTRSQGGRAAAAAPADPLEKLAATVGEMAVVQARIAGVLGVPLDDIELPGGTRSPRRGTSTDRRRVEGGGR